MKENEIYQIFSKYDLHLGRMISFSKSKYREKYPDNFTVFNANVITKENRKVWWGDLDLTIDAEKLKKVAQEMNKILYVLYEMDCRFENEEDSIETLISRAVWNSDKGKLK